MKEIFENPLDTTLYQVVLMYEDDSWDAAEIRCEHLAVAMMLARGWLMTTTLSKYSVIYKDGIERARYSK